MTHDLLFAFITFCLVTSLTPGPNNLMLLASGANFGLGRSMPHLLGVSIGFSVMVALVGIGLSEVFEAFPAAFVALKTVSVAYLLWLAWKIANAAAPSEGKQSGRPITFLQAAAFQWVNPKAWTMALTAVTVYSPGHTLSAVLTTSLIFGLVNFPSCTSWIVLGKQMARFLTSRARLRAFNVVMALLLVASLWPVLMSA